VAAARERAVPVWSEVELGYRFLPGNPVLGVTGTNGKTTTTELLGAIFRVAGRPVEVAGNVGRPLTTVVDPDPDAWVVAELSSFQLEDVDSFRAAVGVLLNVTPDHLDRHGSMESYTAAKLRLFENQTEDDTAVVPAGFGPVPGAGRQVEFSAEDVLPADPRLPGVHNRENAAAATAAARAAGIPDEAIAEALRSFAGVPHRLEPVREVDGVRYVNDSKATNPEAAERALTAYERIRIILGGSRKRASFDGLARTARERGVLRAYLIGESAPEIAAALAGEGVPATEAGDLGTAVRAAAADAEPGDVVLLSPACASFDQFRDYEDRGERFRALVEAL
jgi:UDP-N-acetylmuramoylalanine--D-glutamate ligase